MTLRIEIQEQPERKRFWAEVEMGGMVARRKEVTSPKEDGLSGILSVVYAAAAEMDPRIMTVAPEHQPASQAVTLDNPNILGGGLDALRTEAGAEVEAGDYHALANEKTKREYHAFMDAMRAEAESLGVRVDRRWGEARLREKIAAAGREKANEPAPTGD